MRKFKVGDRVKALSTYKKGILGTVAGFFPGTVKVRVDDYDYRDETGYHGFSVRELELLPVENKTWGEMTREEKGELLLAHHEGKVIQERVPAVLDYHAWVPVPTHNPSWRNDSVYRMKPEPVVETVVLQGLVGQNGYALWSYKTRPEEDTHKITFNLVDGVVDCNSVKMEVLLKAHRTIGD